MLFLRNKGRRPEASRAVRGNVDRRRRRRRKSSVGSAGKQVQRDFKCRSCGQLSNTKYCTTPSCSPDRIPTSICTRWMERGTDSMNIVRSSRTNVYIADRILKGLPAEYEYVRAQLQLQSDRLRAGGRQADIYSDKLAGSSWLGNSVVGRKIAMYVQSDSSWAPCFKRSERGH